MIVSARFLPPFLPLSFLHSLPPSHSLLPPTLRPPLLPPSFPIYSRSLHTRVSVHCTVHTHNSNSLRVATDRAKLAARGMEYPLHPSHNSWPPVTPVTSVLSLAPEPHCLPTGSTGRQPEGKHSRPRRYAKQSSQEPGNMQGRGWMGDDQKPYQC